MEKLCAGVGPEHAVYCCACEFPLPLFCEEHANKHISTPANHFTLPLTAYDKITSKEAFYDVQNRLSYLSNNFRALRERYVEFSRVEEKIDAVYQEVQSHASEVRAKLKNDFSVVKTGFQTAIENAISETSAHALEEFQPENPFSSLLWYNDPGYIARCYMYFFQANCVKEHLDAGFQVAVQVTVPGFEHFKFGAIVPREREEEFMRTAALKDEQYRREVEQLKKGLEDAQTELSRLRNDSAADQRVQALEKEKLAAQVRGLNQDLEVKSQRLLSQAKELEALQTQLSVLEKDRDDQLAALNMNIYLLQQDMAALANQVKAKDDQLYAAHSDIAAYQLETVKLNSQIEERKSPAEPEQKLIATFEDQVRYFDLASDTWKPLFAFRQSGLMKLFGGSKKIQVDYTTVSTFIPPNRIFVCGGGWSVKTACTCHVGRSAYMLEGDGSARELPPMSTGRRYHGVAWDSVRQALYVFGGYSGTGTCYTDPLRASEMFLSEWSPLPDMHQARAGFNPCWHSSIVYLCGGGPTNSVETYDPRSTTFVLQDFTLPESNSGTTAVVENGTLTVISAHYISKLQQGRLTSQKHPEYGPWSSCTPLVSGGVVYVVRIDDNCCRCIDLTTGAVQKAVKLS